MKKKKKYNNKAIIKLVDSVPQNLKALEVELGMPATMLSKVMNETRGMPKHWRLKLESFVESQKVAKLG